MTAHVLHTFERDPQDAIRRGIRRFEHTHDDVFLLVFVRLIIINSVKWPEPVSVFQAQAARRKTAHYRLLPFRIKPAPGAETMPPPRGVFCVREQVRRGADDAITVKIVSHRDRDGQRHAGLPLDFGHIVRGNVGGRGFQMKHRVQDQLQP
jgi:hypothetical protein